MENQLQASRIDIQWNANLPVYASEASLKTESDEFGWVGGKDDQRHLRCVLPYIVLRKGGIRMIRFRTAPIPLEAQLSIEQEKSFLNSVVEHFRSSGADLILPSGNTAIFRTCPDGAEVAPYGTFVKDLNQDEAALKSEIRRTYRQNIRKAEEAGVEIKTGMNYLDTSFWLISETMKRSGLSFKSCSEFRRKMLGLGENVEIFVAEHQGVVQGCMVSPFSLHTAYNCYAGSKCEPVQGAMHFLHWEAIRRFRAMGVRFFDFQGVRINPEKGSKQEGIASYKRGFGGRLVEGYMWKYSLNRMRSIRYSISVRLFKGGDIVDQERHKRIAR